MGITKKQRDEIWRNVPCHLNKEEAMELCEVINKLYNKVYKEEDNKNTEENKNTNKVTLGGYIAYLKDMYQRYGNISIAQLKHIERNIKKEGNR
jgi:hypothetical protein